jgi:hypothetical protein
MLVCAGCNQQMRPKKNGVTFLEMAGDRPYKLWDSDAWECQTCGAVVLYASPNQKPIAEHYQPDFAAKVESYKPPFHAKEWSRK